VVAVQELARGRNIKCCHLRLIWATTWNTEQYQRFYSRKYTLFHIWSLLLSYSNVLSLISSLLYCWCRSPKIYFQTEYKVTAATATVNW